MNFVLIPAINKGLSAVLKFEKFILMGEKPLRAYFFGLTSDLEFLRIL